MKICSSARLPPGVEKVVPKRLDIDEARCKLQSLVDRVNDLDHDELLKDLDDIMSSSVVHCNNKQRDKSFSYEIAQLKNETNEAFKLYQKCTSDFFKEIYFSLRKQLHRKIRESKIHTRERCVADLLQQTDSLGIRALYRPAKKPQSGNSGSVSLHEWYKFYTELYQTFEEPNFQKIPTVLSEPSLNLLASFTPAEVSAALQHQRSKAAGYSGVSPSNLRELHPLLTPILTKLFNEFLQTKSFPKTWMSTLFFFLHKKGSFDDPNNYRSLAIEEPFLKVFMTAITLRLSTFAEENGLLPDFQFGFRKSLSTVSAISVLKQCVENAFRRRKRVYACFVDYKKAFDLVNRDKLFVKLQRMGIPSDFCQIIHNILAGLRPKIRSNGALSPEFETYNGVPQGDPLSPLLYTLFTADLPHSVVGNGVSLDNHNLRISYLVYADDLVLLSETPLELQDSLLRLDLYARENDLTVNVTKTKCMVFHLGYCPKHTFYFQGKEIENCRKFTYLGVVLTTQWSASQHVEHIISKCNQRAGILFSRLPMRSLPISLVHRIFQIYILPIVTYALPMWYPKVTASSKSKLNAILTKFLKRFLGIPYAAYNSITYFLTNSAPLSETLASKVQQMFFNISYPTCLEGLQLAPPEDTVVDANDVIHSIPSFFWINPVIELPRNPASRRALLYDVFDLHHTRLCIDGNKHPHPTMWCLCKYCGDTVQRFHYRICSHVKSLTPCARMRKLEADTASSFEVSPSG
jgi:hypothetical protein